MKYAIVESGGKQYRAVEGGTIEVDRLPLEIGANVKLEQILLLADGENFTVGTPLVQDSPVWTTVVEHFKGEKVTIFNYSPKKRIRVKTGHRQNYTRLLVEQIGGSELVKREPVKKAEKPVRADKKTEIPTEKAADAAKAEVKVEKAAPKVKKPAAATKAEKPAEKKTTRSATKPVAKKPAAKPAAKKPAAKPAAKKTTTPKPAAKKK